MEPHGVSLCSVQHGAPSRDDCADNRLRADALLLGHQRKRFLQLGEADAPLPLRDHLCEDEVAICGGEPLVLELAVLCELGEALPVHIRLASAEGVEHIFKTCGHGPLCV